MVDGLEWKDGIRGSDKGWGIRILGGELILGEIFFEED